MRPEAGGLLASERGGPPVFMNRQGKRKILDGGRFSFGRRRSIIQYVEWNTMTVREKWWANFLRFMIW